MTQLDILDEIEARRLRDEGMRTAFDHAEEIYPDWGAKANRVLAAFLSQSVSDTFMTEDVRAWSTDKLVAPPHKRAWGQVILRAARAGRIYKVGYSRCKDPSTHGTPATLWKIAR